MIHFGHRSGSRRGRIVAAGSGQSCRVARHLPNRPLLAIAGPLFLLLALFWSSSLWAHAALVATQPAAGAVLAEPPEQVSLTFNEPVAPLRFQLLTPGGRALEPAALRHQGGEIQLRLPPLEEQGSHVLSWRVVSADGHPVGGSLLFSIGQAGAVASAGEAAHAGRSLALWLARLAVYAGLFFGLGGVAFRALSAAGRSGEPSDPSRCALLGLVLLGGAAVVLSLGLFGLDALDLGFGAWQTPEVWQVALHSSVGLALALALAALALGLAALWRAGKGSRGAGVLALALLGLSLAASGHASVAPPQWLSRPAVWLHGVAVALWLGSFLPLIAQLRRPQSADLGGLQRFSRLIPFALLGLLVSGGVLTLLQLDRFADLWSTAYGRVLLAKLALVALLLALGAINRYRLTPRVLNGEEPARQSMRRVLRLELVVALLILALVALWRFTPPPRNLALTMTAPAVSSQLSSSEASAELKILPAAEGQGRALQLRLFDADQAPLAAQEVHVVFANEAAGIEPLRFAATAEQGGWQVTALELPELPEWNVEVEVLVSDFDRIRLRGELSLSP